MRVRDRLDLGRGVRDLDEMVKVMAELQTGAKTVALCHGVFDLLHIGHIRHLKEARRAADYLVVSITPDQFVNKGPHRPAFTARLRAEALAALRQVDFVVINQWPTAVEVLDKLKPNVYVKGPDYRLAEDDLTGGITREREAIEAVGGRLIFTSDITFSSSHLLNRYYSPFSEEMESFLKGMRGQREELLGIEKEPLLDVSWNESGLEIENSATPYFSGRPTHRPTPNVPRGASPWVKGLIAAASAYLWDEQGMEPDEITLAKFLDHLLK